MMDKEYRYSKSLMLYSVVMWQNLQGNTLGRVQMEISRIPKLSWWSSHKPQGHIYPLPPVITDEEDLEKPRPRSTRPTEEIRLSKELKEALEEMNRNRK